MVTTLIVIVITILCIAHFYLKSSVLTSFATIISAVFGMIAAFNYYEILADMLISRDYGGQWAQPVCFVLLFVVGFAVTRSLADFIVGTNINFGKPATQICAVVSGIIVGLLTSGVLIITIAMLPVSSKLPYPRFADKEEPIRATSLESPNKAFLNADGFVASLFNWISKGSLSSKRSFGVYHADFIDQIHLNTCRAKDGVITVAAKDAVSVPKNAVRILSDNRIAIRTGIAGKDIADGGVIGEDGKISFTPGQVRLICKDKNTDNNTRGSAKVFYPQKFNLRGNPAQDVTDLGTIITIARNDPSLTKKRVAWVDFLFQIPNNLNPVLLEFKQNSVVELPKTVTSTDEIEQQLDEQD